MHEALQPIWLWLTIIVVGALLFALFKWRGEVGAFAKKFARKEKKPDAHGHDNHHKKDDHHAGGGHSHGDNALTWTLKMAGLAVLVVTIIVVVKSLDVKPGASPETRYNIALRTGTLGNGSPNPSMGGETPCTPDIVIAPPKSEDWSEWVEIPPNFHQVWFCDRERDPFCKTEHMSDERFTAQCRNENGEPVDWDNGNCRNSSANRIQSRTEEAVATECSFIRKF